ncbi:hypothetical protein DM01DRAFT_1333254 [Hesseltinella vesiculosa]|uniref:PSI domain-containing protein n=1 Tax=Hesseltinella vesiculosa TaxID=101127 RepID=A0A1X2GRV6_9FUNG|nr:hypothetical protein DM01DRAFT_1333254 [Hesseltinella vesiculosa]
MHPLLFLSLCWLQLPFAAWASPLFNQTNIQHPHLGDYTHSHESIEKPTYTCVSLGQCDICTPLEKKTASYCFQYGNKEPVRCEWDDPNWYTNRSDPLDDDDVILLPTFRPCPWVQRIEQLKILKFESINLAVAVCSLLVFLWRHRKLSREKYQQLVQRIGA